MEQVGMVKWFDEAKGYGFITPAGGGPDIFVHFSNIVAEGFKTLQKNQQVKFEPFVGAKGPSALQVEVISVAPVSVSSSSPDSTEEPRLVDFVSELADEESNDEFSEYNE